MSRETGSVSRKPAAFRSICQFLEAFDSDPRLTMRPVKRCLSWDATSGQFQGSYCPIEGMPGRFKLATRGNG